MPLLEGAGQTNQTRVSSELNFASICAMISLPSCRKVDCQKEFEDFTDESRQLEQELETTLLQNEKQIRDLNSAIISLREDNESLRVST